MAEKISFEIALENLDKIVKALESGDLPLDEALAKYQEGMKLAKYCHQQIKDAEALIVKMMKGDSLEDFIQTEE
ncbi:MAG: exodeoxyribonuclease VII small subunit [Bacilli bacterium]|nr:exodeoxyribonuclease VII small subunit [Bacilli bacterium]